jgi:hypothetical protein
MPTISRERALRMRLATQRLAGSPLPVAADAVRLLACVQSQERDHAMFSLGMRTRRATYASVRSELDAGSFLRTHILRPTWHFVAPEDLRWILALTSPRVVTGMRARHRELGLDDPRFLSRALDALAALLSGRQYATRRQIGEAFTRAGGLPEPGPQLGHALLLAELEGLICSGPLAGVHHTYALVDEVVPAAPTLDPDEAHARLVRRFFAGHGPASVRDFTRWSSLTAAGTNAALTEIGDELERVEIDGVSHWYDPAAQARGRSNAPVGFLFPVYDEVVLTYPAVTFEQAPGHPLAGTADAFWARAVAALRNVGSWKRVVGAGRVRVEVRLAPSATEEERSGIDAAAGRLARFLGRELDLSVTTGSATVT